jgi:hypothetical protein
MGCEVGWAEENRGAQGRDEGDVYRQKRQCRMLRVRLVVQRLGVERVGVA